jgi:hypothetical protein
MHYFSTLFGKELYMFQSIIRSLSASEVRMTGNITSMTNTDCCEYSIKTPDDGQ